MWQLLLAHGYGARARHGASGGPEPPTSEAGFAGLPPHLSRLTFSCSPLCTPAHVCGERPRPFTIFLNKLIPLRRCIVENFPVGLRSHWERWYKAAHSLLHLPGAPTRHGAPFAMALTASVGDILASCGPLGNGVQPHSLTCLELFRKVRATDRSSASTLSGFTSGLFSFLTILTKTLKISAHVSSSEKGKRFPLKMESKSRREVEPCFPGFFCLTLHLRFLLDTSCNPFRICCHPTNRIPFLLHGRL